MQRKLRAVLALILVVALLLSGCHLGLVLDVIELFSKHYNMDETTHYSRMQYTRPDMVQYQQNLDTCLQLAREGKDIKALAKAINTFYDAYDSFCTNYNLADIHYCHDMTDAYWTEEYHFCLEQAGAVDTGLEEMYYALAVSPLRSVLDQDAYFGPDFLDDYEGGSPYSPEYLALLEEEAALLQRYYDLTEAAAPDIADATTYYEKHAPGLVAVYVELVAVRQKIAAAAGFASYVDYAYAAFGRSYTADKTYAYLQAISRDLGQMYAQLDLDRIDRLVEGYCGAGDALDYVEKSAKAMGGDLADAFAVLKKAGVYDLDPGQNKYDSSFEVYLWNYQVPFIFVNPWQNQTDKLTFAHEFGHFTNDWVCGGSYTGTDVAEVHSQGFEYLSLFYAGETADLTTYRLADSLCIYVENAAHALFEQEVYRLTGDALTVENVLALYGDIMAQFGLDRQKWDSRDLVTIPHFYTHPMYVISYVVSNDLAMQLYQLEKAQSGAGLAVYQKCLSSQDSDILAFAAAYGLEDPMAEGRTKALAETFREILG